MGFLNGSLSVTLFCVSLFPVPGVSAVATISCLFLSLLVIKKRKMLYSQLTVSRHPIQGLTNTPVSFRVRSSKDYITTGKNTKSSTKMCPIVIQI